MAMSMGERAEEGASRAPVVGAVRPVMSSMSQAEEARLESLSMQVAMSTTRQTEGGAPEASFVDVVTGQASVSMSPSPFVARGAALEELPPLERSASLEVGAGMSRSLVPVAALDEAAEERKWGSVHTEVRDAVHALTTMLSSMRDIVTPVGQV